MAQANDPPGVPEAEEFPQMVDLPFVSYTLNGSYRINTPIFMQDLADVNRRLAIIISGGLFFNATEFWKPFNANVAAGIHKDMAAVMHATNVRNRTGHPSIRAYGTRIDSRYYIVDEEKRLSNTRDDPRFTSNSSGCFEMAVSNRFLVAVSFSFEIDCRVITPGQDLAGFWNVPEPHHFWRITLDEIETAHENNNRPVFSPAFADATINLSDRYRAVSYVQYREVFHRNIFHFNN